MVYNYTQARAPIAAMFKSPGPATYGLPGLVGHPTHDPRSTQNKYPAYSFGVKHGKLKDDCSPGPCYLPSHKIYKDGQDGTPHYSLYGRYKDQSEFKVPGPGAYSPEKVGPSAHHHHPQYSFGLRTRQRKNDTNPAPNAYTLDMMTGKTIRSSKRQAPIFTMRPKHNNGSFTEDLAKTSPGYAPGLDAMVGRTLQSRKLSAPVYTMRPKYKTGSFYEDLDKTPGPGTYNTANPDTTKNKMPMYSMTSRNMMPGDASQKPGPGAHCPERVYMTKRAAPQFSFGIRHSDYIAPLIVDPIE